jgi:hypothetical protein
MPPPTTLPKVDRSGVMPYSPLRRTRSDAKARHHLVEDQHRAVPRALLAHRGEEFGFGCDQVHVAGHRFNDHAGDGRAVLGEGVRQTLGIVVVEHQGVLRQVGRHAGRGRIAEGQQARAGLDQQAVAMAVVTALELDDHIAPGEAARQADRAHRSLGAGRHQAHHVHARHALHQQLGQFDLSLGWRAEGKALGRRLLHGSHRVGIGMTEDQRSPGTDVVEVGLAVGIPDPRALAARKKSRRAAYRAKGSDG